MADHHASSRPAPDLIEDGIPATTDAPPGLDVDAVEGEPVPLDHSQGAEEWGITAAEEAMGEPFELRVLREEPDIMAGDVEDAEIEDVLGSQDSLSAEESALRVVDEPPGMSYAPDPGYLSDDD